MSESGRTTSFEFNMADLNMVIAALWNVRQFVPDWEFQTIMGVEKDELLPLAERLEIARSKLK